MSLPLVAIEQVSVWRGTDVVLRDFSLQVERGQVHAIVGRNGSGKSTLLSAMLGLLPFAGRISLNFTTTGRIGYVPQSFHVDSTLPVTVADFLALTRQRRPVCLGLSRATRANVSALLARVGLTGFEPRPLAGLSGGELRRVLLAHALDPDPELLLLDEPATGLDATSGQWLEDTLRALKTARRTTTLLVSHDQAQVARVADVVTTLGVAP